MLQKIIDINFEITQDDIDYLKRRACQSLKKMAKAKSQREKIFQWKLFVAYNGLYMANKDKAVK